MHLINLNQTNGVPVKVNPEWICLITPYGQNTKIIIGADKLEIEVTDTPQEIYNRILNSSDLYKNARRNE